LPRGKYIVDLKTGSTIDDNAYMQTAAYGSAFEEMDGKNLVGSLMIHTGAKNRTGIEGLATHYRNRDEMLNDFEDYRHAASLWERKNANAKPKVFEFPMLISLKGE
jgi:hypothetical protein